MHLTNNIYLIYNNLTGSICLYAVADPNRANYVVIALYIFYFYKFKIFQIVNI